MHREGEEVDPSEQKLIAVVEAASAHNTPTVTDV
jgi:hypothetical protein